MSHCESFFILQLKEDTGKKVHKDPEAIRDKRHTHGEKFTLSLQHLAAVGASVSTKVRYIMCRIV